MKMPKTTLLTFACTLSLLAGIAGIEVQAKPNNLPRAIASSESSSKIKMVREFINAVENKDINAINAIVVDNVVIEQPYGAGGVNRAEGRQATNAFFQNIFSRYSQIKFVDLVYRESKSDNTVIIEGSGDFIITENQKPYRNKYIVLLGVDDNKISFIREYFNPLIAAEAFGTTRR